MGWTRFGLDLDLVRYPFLRAGINFDRHYEAPIFVNRQDIETLSPKQIWVWDSTTGEYFVCFIQLSTTVTFKNSPSASPR